MGRLRGTGDTPTGKRLEGGLMFATEDTYHHGYTRRDRAAEYQKEVLAFRLGAEEYALDILRIREIIKPRPTTEVPRAPRFVLGIISVRGQVIPVLDLRARLHMPEAPIGKEGRILIVTKDGEVYGLLVDEVRQVVRMREEDVEPPPPMLSGGDSEFISGIGRPRGERLLILLQLDAVLQFSLGSAAAVRGGGRK